MKAPMTKEEFERLFDAKVGEPLSQLGFQRSGKSLYADANGGCISCAYLCGTQRPQDHVGVLSLVGTMRLPSYMLTVKHQG
jgi:hypothetical protein